MPSAAPAPILFVNDKEARKKHFKSGVRIEDLPEFVREFQEGALPPFLKSEPAPEEDPAAPVKTVTGETYERFITGSGKDAFIEFHAPWCSHCKRLKPVWAEVGDAFAGDADVLVGKIDGTANDV